MKASALPLYGLWVPATLAYVAATNDASTLVGTWTGDEVLSAYQDPFIKDLVAKYHVISVERFDANNLSSPSVPEVFRQAYGNYLHAKDWERAEDSTEPGGLPGINYNANRQGFHVVVNADSHSRRSNASELQNNRNLAIVGFVAGSVQGWVDLGYTCASASNTYPYQNCVTQGVGEFASLVASLLGLKDGHNEYVGAWGFFKAGLPWLRAQFRHDLNQNPGKGSDRDGHDEVKRRGSVPPDSCKATHSYQPDGPSGPYIGPNQQSKTSGMSYCAIDNLSLALKETSARLAHAEWADKRRGQRVAWTVYSESSKRVAYRAVTDIQPDFGNKQECPAEVPGNSDGCKCLSGAC